MGSRIGSLFMFSVCVCVCVAAGYFNVHVCVSERMCCCRERANVSAFIHTSAKAISL